MKILNGEFDKDVLIFPRPDKKVTKINYRDGGSGSNGSSGWNIYGISLDPKAVQEPDIVPTKVQARLDGELVKAKRKTLILNDNAHAHNFETELNEIPKGGRAIT